MKADPNGPSSWFPYKCRSWRHDGECSKHRVQRDYARLAKALEPVSLEDITYAVLTYNPQTAPRELDRQFRELLPRWAALEQLLRRGLRRMGFPGVGRIKYAAYVEGHRNGRPHVNVVIVSGLLARYLRDNPPSESDLDVTASHGGQRAPRWFRTLCQHAGFGPQASLRHALSKEHVTGYVTKFEGTAAHPTLEGEVTKMSQLPIWAPRGFRRTRASPGFLPKLNDWKDPNRTGQLHMSPTPEAQLEAQALEMTRLRNHLWGS